MTTVEDLNFGGAKLIKPGAFEDFRGTYIETYDSFSYKNELGIDIEFIQDDVSTSHKHVIRGIHGDFATHKLVQCLHGSVYNVIVDMNKNSDTYRKWLGVVLNSANKYQLYIPAGFGNSILAMTEDVVYHYKQSTSFIPGRQFTLSWKDPELEIDWGIKHPLLSKRDSEALLLKDQPAL